jgi:glycine cleavage system aminomethyltransferase T
MTQAPARSLQNLIDQTPDLVKYLSNETLSPMWRARMGLLAQFIPPEFTNWRDEQNAWRETTILWDQCHHMPELYIDGPDALKLLEQVGIQSLANFTPDRAKQFVACTPRGYVVGDCVAFCLKPESYVLVSGMPVLNWVHFKGQTGGYDVAIRVDQASAFNKSGGRTHYRFQIEGPNAGKVFHALVDGGAPEIPFFRCAKVQIRGHLATVLRHGMTGHMGVEIFGPYEQMEAIRSAIVAAGAPFGMRQGGTKAYFSSVYESGWIAYPFPAIYTGEELRAYREWLPADSWEGNLQLAGSLQSYDVEDYYLNPWDLGYGRLVKCDRDFIGREALQKMDKLPKRQKLTLVWNHEDVLKVMGSQLGSGPRYKAIELPHAGYGWPQMDEVRDVGGKPAGISTHCGYSNNEGELVSLGVINESHAKLGAQLVLTWGEPNGGSAKPHVERHAQTTIRVTVAPCPYPKSVQKLQRVTIGK